jgi:hypothetical protein
VIHIRFLSNVHFLLIYFSFFPLLIFFFLQRDASGNPVMEVLHLAADVATDYEQWTNGLQGMILRATANLNRMKVGSDFVVVEEKAQFTTLLKLHDDLNSISWQHDGETKSMNLSEVKFVRCGQETPKFRRTKNISHQQNLSFSLIFGSESSTLDLIARNIEDHTYWITGLESLIKGTTDWSLNIFTITLFIFKNYSDLKSWRKNSFLISFSFLAWRQCSAASICTRCAPRISYAQLIYHQI